MKVPELKTGQMITIVYIAGFFIALFVVYKLLGKIGLIKTKEKKQREAAVENLRGVDQFSTTFLQGKTDSYPKLGKTAQNFAVRLRKAISGVGTNEEEIFSIFSQLKSKENISEVAVYYKAAFGNDLLTDLLNYLTNKDKATLMEIIDKLPGR